MLYVALMNLFLMAEINMTLVVFLQLILPIVTCLLLRKQSHRFQSNAIKVLLVLGLGSTPLQMSSVSNPTEHLKR